MRPGRMAIGPGGVGADPAAAGRARAERWRRPVERAITHRCAPPTGGERSGRCSSAWAGRAGRQVSPAAAQVSQGR